MWRPPNQNKVREINTGLKFDPNWFSVYGSFRCIVHVRKQSYEYEKPNSSFIRNGKFCGGDQITSLDLTTFVTVGHVKRSVKHLSTLSSILTTQVHSESWYTILNTTEKSQNQTCNGARTATLTEGKSDTNLHRYVKARSPLIKEPPSNTNAVKKTWFSYWSQGMMVSSTCANAFLWPKIGKDSCSASSLLCRPCFYS